jgi:hypothetical protein
MMFDVTSVCENNGKRSRECVLFDISEQCKQWLAVLYVEAIHDLCGSYSTAHSFEIPLTVLLADGRTVQCHDDEVLINRQSINRKWAVCTNCYIVCSETVVVGTRSGLNWCVCSHICSIASQNANGSPCRRMSTLWIFLGVDSFNSDFLCGPVVRIHGCRTEMYCISREVRTEFMYVM